MPDNVNDGLLIDNFVPFSLSRADMLHLARLLDRSLLRAPAAPDYVTELRNALENIAEGFGLDAVRIELRAGA